MNVSKKIALSAALAVAATSVFAAPGFARNVKQGKAQDAYARSVTGVNDRGAYDDLSRYGNRNGATVWLPGTTSPRVNSQ